ncbi:MAG: hypothetical protein LQ339_005205 [Xanthoria mediterranea]|nr:MAG: hypothetical protein LQ339_005205 [Xanthoria mediterranea]
MSESHLPDNLIFHGNGGSYPPHGRITAENHGPAVVVGTWIMVCLMGLAIIARFGTRPSLGRDSITIFSACVLALIQSVLVHLAVDRGLGRHRTKLSLEDYSYYSKAVFTSQILMLLVHYLAKLTLLLVFLQLTPSKPMRRMLWAFILLLSLWACAAIITYSTQCPLPQPWDLSAAGCYNQEALYLFNGIIIILSDVVIIALPYALLRDVQIRRSRKVTVYIVFLPRIVVCIMTALQLSSLREYLQNDDKTWLIVDATIWGQVSMNLSIITACAPMIKPLFDMLQFSLIDSAIPLPGGAILLESVRPRANS